MVKQPALHIAEPFRPIKLSDDISIPSRIENDESVQLGKLVSDSTYENESGMKTFVYYIYRLIKSNSQFRK